MVRPLFRSLSAATLLLSLVAHEAPAFADAAGAKVRLSAADKAAQTKDWVRALREYAAANEAEKSAPAQEGIANALYQLGQFPDAYEAYEEYLKIYGDKLSRPVRIVAEARMKELAEKTGVLVITSDAGAQILVDDNSVGKAPLAKAVRVMAGVHKIRATRETQTTEQTINITAGGNLAVSVRVEDAKKGRLSVAEKNQQKLRVLIDNVDVGETPWIGDVEPGMHDIGGRSPTMTAVAEKVLVERGKRKDVVLDASSSTALFKVTTSDGKGAIFLDGKLVGEGAFSSEVPAGTHKIVVTRDGFERFEEDVVLKEKETQSRTVTLKIDSKVKTGAVEADRRSLSGTYASAGFLGLIAPSDLDGDVDRACASPSSTLLSCSGGPPGFGAGVLGYIGYGWDPVGLELMVNGTYDQSSRDLNFIADSTSPGLGPDPARTEKFTFRRLGGTAALRIRLMTQSERVRFGFAVGAGMGYRNLSFQRDTTAAAGGPADVYAPPSVSYWSPVVNVEPSVAWRLTPTLALALGVELSLENPNVFDSAPRTASEKHTLGISPLSTPSYEIINGSQLVGGLFVGMQFGP